MTWFRAAGFEFQEFSAGGVRTFVIVEGREGGVPLLLLHGVPGASFVWSTTIQAVGRDTKVIAPDLPGWGRSLNRAKPEKIRLTCEFLKTWLESALDAQGILEFDAMGQGCGAWLALELLLADPARVRRLGLVNLPLREEKSGLRLPWGNDWTGKRVEKWVGTLSEATQRVSRPLFDELLGGSFSPKRSPEFPEGEFRERLSDYKECLRRFEGEVLCMWGAKDAMFDETLAREFAGGRYSVVFEESSRYPMWDEAARYKAVVTEFFADTTYRVPT